MGRLNIPTWHTHGSSVYYLSQAPHEFHGNKELACYPVN